jgi:hypothetical protein
MRSSARRVAIAALVAVAACASTGAKREARLHAELDQYQYPQPLEKVWPQALHLLADKGYPLVGKDREAAGQSPQGTLSQLFTAGFETSKVEGRGLVLETGYDKVSFRYRVEGWSTSAGTCRIVFTRIEGNPMEASIENRVRDTQMEKELASLVDPQGEARMESAADAAARSK